LNNFVEPYRPLKDNKGPWHACKEVHSFSLGKEYGWAVITKTMEELKPTLDFTQWKTVYGPSSITLMDVKRTKFLKLTTCGEVFVDKKLRNKEFKSEKFVGASMEEAAAKFKDWVKHFHNKVKLCSTPAVSA